MIKAFMKRAESDPNILGHMKGEDLALIEETLEG